MKIKKNNRVQSALGFNKNFELESSKSLKVKDLLPPGTSHSKLQTISDSHDNQNLSLKFLKYQELIIDRPKLYKEHPVMKTAASKYGPARSTSTVKFNLLSCKIPNLSLLKSENVKKDLAELPDPRPIKVQDFFEKEKYDQATETYEDCNQAMEELFGQTNPKIKKKNANIDDKIKQSKLDKPVKFVKKIIYQPKINPTMIVSGYEKWMKKPIAECDEDRKKLESFFMNDWVNFMIAKKRGLDYQYQDQKDRILNEIKKDRSQKAIIRDNYYKNGEAPQDSKFEHSIEKYLRTESNLKRNNFEIKNIKKIQLVLQKKRLNEEIDAYNKANPPPKIVDFGKGKNFHLNKFYELIPNNQPTILNSLKKPTSADRKSSFTDVNKVEKQEIIKKMNNPFDNISSLQFNKGKMIRKKINQEALVSKLKDFLMLLSECNIELSEFFKYKIFPQKPFEKEGSYMFLKCVKKNDIDSVKIFLRQNKYLIYDYDYIQQTALHWAAKRGFYDMVTLLLEYKPNVKQVDLVHFQNSIQIILQGGKTPIFYAIRENWTEIAQLLLIAGSSPWSTQSFKIDQEKCSYEMWALIKKARQFHILMAMTPPSMRKSMWKTNAKKNINIENEIEETEQIKKSLILKGTGMKKQLNFLLTNQQQNLNNEIIKYFKKNN